MASVSSSNDSKDPLRAMSLARFVPRFSKPRLLTSEIPTYRHSLSLPVPDRQKTTSNVPSPSEHPSQIEHQPAVESNEAPEQASNASYVEWSKLLPAASNLLDSFQDLFELGDRLRATRTGTSDDAGQDQVQDQVGTQPPASAFPPPRLVFFGEQHHQPQVLRAQLQALHALHHQCRRASEHALAEDAGLCASSNHAHSTGTSPTYRLHLVLEHFSVLDQNMLDSFTNGQLGPDELADAYQEQSEEGFHIGHYMPLLMLAKELNVPIWGGFPPRRWAKQVFRDGIDSVMAEEQQRFASSQKDASLSAKTTSHRNQGLEGLQAQDAASRTPPRLPLFTSWDAVTNIGAAHRGYLSGLMRPDLPPRFPKLPDSNSDPSSLHPPHHTQERHGKAKRLSAIYPTWLLEPHVFEKKGFGPAQALKDSYLAHVTAWIIRGTQQDAQNPESVNKAQAGSTAPPSPSSQPAATAAIHNDVERPVVNVALVVCGLGHCEYGFGAPERVVELLSQRTVPSEDSATLLPYIVASKPIDSGIWLGCEHPVQRDASPSPDRDTGDSVATFGDTDSIRAHELSPDAVKRWLSDPWGRKLADAVLLYDWIDDEPAERVDASVNKSEPLSKSGTAV